MDFWDFIEQQGQAIGALLLTFILFAIIIAIYWLVKRRDEINSIVTSRQFGVVIRVVRVALLFVAIATLILSIFNIPLPRRSDMSGLIIIFLWPFIIGEIVVFALPWGTFIKRNPWLIVLFVLLLPVAYSINVAALSVSGYVFAEYL